MKRDDLVNLIGSCPFFSGLDRATLQSIAQITIVSKYDKDEFVFFEQDDAEAFFILIDGAVDLIKSSPSGKEHVIRSINGGEVFAEAVMFSGGQYPATAVVRKKSEILAVEKKKFVELIRRNPQISLKIMGVMAILLRHLNSQLADASLSQVSVRLASYLLKMSRESGKNNFILDMKKKELATKLNTVPETLSRNLKKLEKQGVISVKGGKIIINNINKLEAELT